MPYNWNQMYILSAVTVAAAVRLFLFQNYQYHSYAIIVISFSITGFLIYGVDKLAAVRKGARVPESILLGLGFTGGFPGCLAGMAVFRHKIRKWYFWAVNLLAVLPHMYLTRYLGLWPDWLCYPLPWP